MSRETDIIQFQPLTTWPGELNNDRRRALFKQRGKFENDQWKPGGRIPVGRTITQLRRELEHLSATNVLILLDCEPSQITRQGWPRANARVNQPGVVLTFESAYGPLSYPCDTFTRWEDNLRAITLALEALRKVDRYGVTQRGEQYSGWKQLPGPGQTSTTMTAGAAAEYIAKHSGWMAKEILSKPDILNTAYRIAAAVVHPDRGGSHDDMAMLSVARDILKQHHGMK